MKKHLFALIACLLLAVTINTVKASSDIPEDTSSHIRYLYSYQGFLVLVHQDFSPKGTKPNAKFDKAASKRCRMLRQILKKNGFTPTGIICPQKIKVLISVTPYISGKTDQEAVLALGKKYTNQPCNSKNRIEIISTINEFKEGDKDRIEIISIVEKSSEKSFNYLVGEIKGYLKRSASKKKR